MGSRLHSYECVIGIGRSLVQHRSGQIKFLDLLLSYTLVIQGAVQNLVPREQRIERFTSFVYELARYDFSVGVQEGKSGA